MKKRPRKDGDIISDINRNRLQGSAGFVQNDLHYIHSNEDDVKYTC
jgi:hypothetical protein